MTSPSIYKNIMFSVDKINYFKIKMFTTIKQGTQIILKEKMSD